MLSKHDRLSDWIVMVVLLQLFVSGCAIFQGGNSSDFDCPSAQKGVVMGGITIAQNAFAAHGMKQYTWNGKAKTVIKTIQDDGSPLVWYSYQGGMWGAKKPGGGLRSAYTYGLVNKPTTVYYSQNGYINPTTATHEGGTIILIQHGIKTSAARDPILRKAGIW